jgi:hypothetical protein
VQSVRGSAIKRSQNQRFCLGAATRVHVDREVQSLARNGRCGSMRPALRSRCMTALCAKRPAVIDVERTLPAKAADVPQGWYRAYMVRLGKGRRPRQSRHCIASAKQGPPTEAGLLVAALDTKRTLRGFARRTPNVVGTAQPVFLSPSRTPALGETFDDARMIEPMPPSSARRSSPASTSEARDRWGRLCVAPRTSERRQEHF